MYHVKSEKQLVALTSPARQEIVDALQAAGRSTVAEIADQLGRPADSLYYHVRKLVSVGLLVEAGRQRSGSRDEAIYNLPGNIKITYNLGNRRIMEPLARAVSAMMRLADRDFRAAARSRHAKGDGPGRNLWGGRGKAWLTGAEVREVRKHLEAIVRILNGARRTPKSQLHTVTWVLAPVEPNERARTGKDN